MKWLTSLIKDLNRKSNQNNRKYKKGIGVIRYPFIYQMDIRVVIPCYNEPDVLCVINSLFTCQSLNLNVEIIIIVNSYRISSNNIIEINRKTFEQLEQYASIKNTSRFHLTPILVEDLPGHQTGAGVPRKIGMDIATDNFYKENNPNGILVSLDADCTVENNYLIEIYSSFKKYKLKSATIEFYHPVEHLSKRDKIRKATEVYEEYLRYYQKSLEYTGYPYAYHTIGSAFAVTAKIYKQVGGMGKQQAGEDFYFLQKVFPLGKTQFIQSTRVYPAARISDRVPFGTGPAIAKMIKDEDIKKLSYQFKAFDELRLLFEMINLFFKSNEEEIKHKCKQLPKHMQLFLEEDNFLSKMKEINSHTATTVNFKKRFFNYFNAFKILKYLNYVHPSPYQLMDVKSQFDLLKDKFNSSS